MDSDSEVIMRAPKDRKAKRRLMDWIMDARDSLTSEFQSAMHSIIHYMESILNFFDNRSTNAAAESFNAKSKL